ncbi:MAG TPA: lysylphosphatidylglycerol synthase domain-containing protein [Chitinispirillaceae bacterium]|nr:lysylphosphatidylglycerol synthase domain-containing protein [Chitinispirillaceae bacterium]
MVSAKKNKHIYHLILSLVSLTFLIVATFFLLRVVRGLSLREIVDTINAIHPGRLAIASLLCLLNYAVMTGYDWIGLRYAGVHLPFRKVVFTSFVGDTLNNNLGLSAIVGSTIKFRFYSTWGIGASSIARAIGFYTIGYWLGFSFLSSISFLYYFPQIGFLGDWSRHLQLVISILLMVPVILFVTMLFQNRIKKVSLGKFHIDIPSPGKGLAIVLVGILDWTITGVMFYILMPQTALRDVFKFISMYVISHIAGMASQVPGGLAVFESAAMLMNQEHATVNIMASLLLFRLLFFIAPFIAGLAGFLFFEIKMGHKFLSGRKKRRQKASMLNVHENHIS